MPTYSPASLNLYFPFPDSYEDKTCTVLLEPSSPTNYNRVN